MVSLIRKLWPYVRPYRTRLVLGMICGMLCAVANGMLILVIKVVVNLVFGPGAESVADELNKLPTFLHPLRDLLMQWLPALSAPSSTAGLVLVAMTVPTVMLVRSLFGYLNVYLMSWSAVRAIAGLRVQLFEHLLNLPLGFFNQAKTGDLISRVTNDTQVLYSIVGNSLAALIRDPVTIVVLVCLLLAQQPTLTLISLVVLPICFGPIIVYGRKVRRSARAMQGHISELTSLMHESFTSNRIIKAYNLEDTMLGQFRETTKKYISHIMRVVRSNEIPGQVTEFLGGVGVALVLIYVALQGTAKTPGDFMQFVLSIVMMYPSIKALTKLHNQMNQASAASQRVFELLAERPDMTEPPKPARLNAKDADIHFENIHFAYKKEQPVLQGINLTVKAGQFVALVGGTGSGKTSLINLLFRFYDPQQGSVRIGQTDVRDLSIKELRRQIALVSQETILFNDVIRHNIAVGRPGAADREIEIAARHAHAHDFIMEHPEGYQRIIGEKGVTLSGGQRQRIALARAIIKDAPVLVLDEATSSLDAKVERDIQEALDELMEGRTTICIAHRLSTIQRADVIVVLDHGRIVETGTHAELMQARGTYCKLYELSVHSGGVNGDGT